MRPTPRRSTPRCARPRRSRPQPRIHRSDRLSRSLRHRVSDFASCRRWRGSSPASELRINEAEVDDAFEVPLAFLMDPANHQLHSKEFRGMERVVLRDAVRRTLHLGRDRRNPARAVRADLSAMIRPAFTEVGIFLIPFAVYALFLIATRSGTAGAVVVAAASRRQADARFAAAGRDQSCLAGAFPGAPPHSTYVPAHIENGKFVPGVEK